MSESARALTDSIPNTVETAAQPLGFDEAFTLHHRAVFRTAGRLCGSGIGRRRDAGGLSQALQESGRHTRRGVFEGVAVARDDERGAQHLARPVARHGARRRICEAGGRPGMVYAASAGRRYERRMEIEEARRALEKIKEPMRSALLLKQQGMSYTRDRHALCSLTRRMWEA